MLNKILAFAVLSLALLMQPARAETQQNDRELDSIIQALPTLNPQQKAQLLDEIVSQVNERYAWQWKTDELQSGRVSHELPEKPQITYTFQMQPALRPWLDRNREWAKCVCCTACKTKPCGSRCGICPCAVKVQAAFGLRSQVA